LGLLLIPSGITKVHTGITAMWPYPYDDKEYTPWTGHWYSSKPLPGWLQCSVCLEFGKLRSNPCLVKNKNEHSFWLPDPICAF
jgi:hypothetical protein